MTDEKADFQCRACGEFFFPGDLNQVAYHEQVPHKPMAALEWSGRYAEVTEAGPEFMCSFCFKLARWGNGYNRCDECPDDSEEVARLAKMQAGAEAKGEK